MNFSDLKVLSREVASVDKCFINGKTSEGWVRVRSPQDFYRVYSHLNGFNYKGYILSASIENSSKSVYIWDQKKTRAAANASSSTIGSGAGAPNLSPHAGVSPCLDYGYCAPANGSTSAPVEYNACYGYDSGYSSGASSSSGYPYPAQSASHTVTAMPPNFNSYQQYEGAGSSARSWQPYHTPISSGQNGVVCGSGYYGYGCDHQAVHATGEGVSQTAKVIVKNLSRHASPKELESYLLSVVGGRHMLQEDVRFPRQPSSSSGSSSSSSATRQHAFLLFNTHSDALAAVSKLSKTKLLGLNIEARLATEMVLPVRGSPSSTSSYAPPNATSSLTDSGDADLGVDASATLSTNGQTEDTKPKREKSHNLVVDGKSLYGHVKQAIEETKGRDRKHKHRK
ncbi:hypothetical protein SPBR_05974 [Sporothrix brasiliensis 5110]|uniref:RRM domain-containing protein n=1 Tax=Sporothrix brasiliensis 5110 TaxID=1398154 RepID=A0A0C2FT65_9PEZI|nr:uncharacterized protein SPBR_05974 [Sporothrix brasiliensis 5110]KIH94203.1 hypothetical protein SPBR_05974 [Sporothrix brasiliensis 5110]